MHEHTHDTPEDIRALASQLGALGEHERRAAEEAVMRTTMRTAHLLTDPPRPAPSLGRRLRGLWLWAAAPAVAMAAVLLTVLVMAPGGGPAPTPRVEVLAAGIETDIQTWSDLDTMWSGDSFEADVAAISLNAAGIRTQSDSLETLPDLESDL